MCLSSLFSGLQYPFSVCVSAELKEQTVSRTSWKQPEIHGDPRESVFNQSL